MKVTSQFLKSALDKTHFPVPGPPEIAFLGRSNVGKSSVINSLLGEKMAKTSSTPGRTRSINFFKVRRTGKSQTELLFADLPGYGYAKISKEISAEWPKFIEPYLQERPCLSLCVVLVDSNIDPQNSDKQMVEWLQHHQRPLLVVATKSDRISNNALNQSLKKLQEALQIDRILPYSSKVGSGRPELWREISSSANLPT